MNSAGDIWPVTTLSEAGLADDLSERIDAGVRDGRFPNLHSVLIARGGKLALERNYEGEDEVWGRPNGHVVFGPDVLHDLRSISKCVVGLLYGIAQGEGSVLEPGALLSDLVFADPLRRQITVAHALSMMMGTEWDESGSYADPRNSEHAMELAPDRIRFALGRPMLVEPGTQWTYNGGATALLARVITDGVDDTLGDYAARALFTPVGLGTHEWLKGADNEHIAASGLRMRPRDMLAIGQMVLERGRRKGVEVVPEQWLDDSFTPRTPAGDLEYGFHWWLGPERANRRRWVTAMGNGGQRLYVMPGLDMTVLFLAGNYNQSDSWRMPVTIWTDVIVPALR